MKNGSETSRQSGILCRHVISLDLISVVPADPIEEAFVAGRVPGGTDLSSEGQQVVV